MQSWLWSGAFIAYAVLCALAANALAPPERRLAWGGWVPPASLPQATGNGATPAAAAEPQASVPALAPPAPVKASPPPQAAAPEPDWAPDPNAASREISSREAWAAFRQGLPFLDARRSQDFAEGHVPGARSAPVWEAELEARLTEFEARANPTPRGPIVLYCSGGGCEDAHLLARKLEGLGYRNLLIYKGGFPDWTAQGRPVSREARP